MARTRPWLAGIALALAAAAVCGAQQPPSPSLPAPRSAPSVEFLKAADDVLAEMSRLLSLPVLEPLRKSVRSREEIRDYLVRAMREDDDPQKRHADQKALEAFGLLPRDYPLEEKLLALLTEQVAGLYDPKSREFFVADWATGSEQMVILAHELTHALEDQHFRLKEWSDAAKPNDDAGLARDAVLEGSATVAMLDYLLRDIGRSTRDLPELDASALMGEPDNQRELNDVPMVLRDVMLFPYVAGARFVHHVLRAGNGWADLPRLFESPPVSTQQILHPELYLRGVAPVAVRLPSFDRIVPVEWRKLDENVLGEFGLHAVLKQFLGEQRAAELSPFWAGDRYAIFERPEDGATLLVVRLRLGGGEQAARLFGGYSQVLEEKHRERSRLFRRPNFFSFDTPAGGVFLRCVGAECLVVEGTTRAVFDRIVQAMGWPAAPADPRAPRPNTVTAWASPARSALPLSVSPAGAGITVVAPSSPR